MKFHRYLFLFVFVLLQNRSHAKNATKGPYKSIVIETKECAKTSLPRRKPELGPVDAFWVEVYNTSRKANLLRGNFSLNQHGSSFTVISNAYKWQNGKWKPHISIPALECTSPIITFLLKLSNFNFNSTTCEYQKGVYQFSKLDLNVLEHLWASEREYGRVLWRTEMVTKYNTLLCVIFDTLVEPLKTVHKAAAKLRFK